MSAHDFNDQPRPEASGSTPDIMLIVGPMWWT